MTWSVLAMEAAACYIGECRNPTRDAKLAMSTSGLYGYFIYLFLPLMMIAVLGSTDTYDPLTVFLTYTQAIFGDAVWVQATTRLGVEIDPLKNAVVQRVGPSEGSGSVAITADGAVWITAHDALKLYRIPSE